MKKGDEISLFYDPMIAKLIVHADSRQEAIDAMQEMTSNVECWPVKTNAGFLNLLLYDQDFEEGTMDTGLIGNNLQDFIPDEQPSENALQSVAHMVIDKALGGKELTSDRPISPATRGRGQIAACGSIEIGRLPWCA